MTKQAEKMLEYTLATHAVERMKPSQEAVSLCKQIASGSISADYAVAQLKVKYGIRRES